MGGRTISTLKTTFTSGELDPLLVRRTDLKHYFNGADRLRNVVVLPQGGVRRRPGSKYIDTVWPRLYRWSDEKNAASGPAIVWDTPNGIGTDVSNWSDNNTSSTDVTTTNIGSTSPYSVVEVDFIDVITVYAVDVKDLQLTVSDSWNATPVAGDRMVIQYSNNGSTWTDFGPELGTVSFSTPISRRRSGTNRQPVSARYWRLARYTTAGDLTTNRFKMSEFNVYVALNNTYQASNTKIIEVEIADNYKYAVLLSDQNAAVYLNDVWQTDVPIPHTTSQIPSVNWTQSQDTLLLFHKNVETTRILREDSDVIWGAYQVPWSRKPGYRFASTKQPTGVSMTPGATTGTTTLTAGSAWFNSGMVGWYIYSAIRSGQCRIIAYTSTTVVQIEVLEDFASVTAFTDGVAREPAFSNTRGWPACGTFHEERLWLGGSASLPQTVFASRSGDYFDFNDTQSLADYAMIYDIATDAVSAIYNIVSGRHLQLFTASAEFYMLPNDDPITPNTITVKRSTKIGSLGPGVRVALIEGATMFLQRGGHSLREFALSEAELEYNALNVSLLSSHLLPGPQELAHRPGTETDEADWVIVRNSNGSLACLCTLRDQDVTAWSLWQLSAPVKSVGVVDTDIYGVLALTVNSVAVRHFMRFVDDDTYLTDDAVKATVTTQESQLSSFNGQTIFLYTGTSPSSPLSMRVQVNGEYLEYPTEWTVNLGTKTVTLATAINSGINVTISIAKETVTGLTQFIDQELFCIVDGGVAGLATVSNGGVLTLPQPAFASYEIGLRWPDVTGRGLDEEVWIRDMPVDLDLPDGTTVGRKKRVVSVVAAMYESAEFNLGANGEPTEQVTPRTFNVNTMDAVTPDFTGDIRIEGLLGFDDYGQVEITQSNPANLTVLALAKQVSV